MNNDNKKILFIAPNQYYSNEAWSKEIKEISNNLLDCTVITSGKIPDIYIKNENYTVVRNSPSLYLIFAFLTYFYSRKSRINFFEVTPYTAYFTFLTKLIPVRNSIYRISSYSWIDSSNEFSKRIYGTIDNFRMIFVNDKICRDEVAKHISKEKISIISPGINLEKYRYRHFPPLDADFKILFASAPMKPNLYPEIFKWKGIDILLDSIKKLTDEGFVIKLYLLWRDVYIQEIKNMIKERDLENVLLINKTVDMLEYYEKCHITIFPGTNMMYSPCFPSTIMESVSSGRPVIITDVIHISDIIEKSKSGIVCKPTSGNISRSIMYLMKNYHEFQSNCRCTAEKYFDIKNTITKIEEILKSIIKDRDI